MNRRITIWKQNGFWFLMVCLLVTAGKGECQQTVFKLLQNDLKEAETHYKKNNFQGALQLYTREAQKDPAHKELRLQIARCNFFLKKYNDAIAAYDDYMKAKGDLRQQDLYYYAEAQSAVSNYRKAKEYYRKFLEKKPSDDMVVKKIWRIDNIQYVYEDSSLYTVRPLSMNTDFGELCAVPYRDGLVFMSNQKGIQLIDKINANTNAPFYQIYFTRRSSDGNGSSWQEAAIFGRELHSSFHTGPLVFFQRDRKMVFASVAGENETRTLQLYFAEIENGKWRTTSSFPYNSELYSLSDPAISEDGNILFFSSDMKNGFGGMDLYKSEFKNGQWSKPVNLGKIINTPGDEVFPFLHKDQTLYFSSSGHAGLGGLDIFQAMITPAGFSEPKNVGYPLNTSSDDFGLVIDSLETHGYFSSNRKNGGFNDDLYEFDSDRQRYPLTITGMIKYKERSSDDSSDLKPLSHGKIYLIDNQRNRTVHETSSDAEGNFSIVVPYFSSYALRVIGKEGDENMAILEIPQYRKELGSYEIVLIRDTF